LYIISIAFEIEKVIPEDIS